MPDTERKPFVAGLVLGAGASRRLGRPKQLLPFRGRTLLDHTLGVARNCGFDQVVVAVGGAADEVLATVDVTGVDVVVNDAYGSGCSSSIAAALGNLDPRCDLLVLMLGDQPGVTPTTVTTLLAGRGAAPMALCRYDDGLGHPIAFGRELFGELAALHGDKGVWRMRDAHADGVAEVPVAGRVPPDIDTQADYEAALAADRFPL